MDFQKEKYRSTIEILALCMTLLLYMLRTAIPFFKFPFILLFTSLLAFSLIKYKNTLKSTLFEFLKNYHLIIFLGFVLIISFLLSKKIYLIVFKDVVNSLILLSTFFLMALIIRTKSLLQKFVLYFSMLLILFSFIISVNELLKVLTIYSGAEAFQFFGSTLEPNIALTEIDNNFGILPVILAMITVINLLITNTYSKKFNGVFNILLVVFSLSIFFSGSRRALLVLLSLVFLILITHIINLFIKREFVRRIASQTSPFLIGLTILSLFASVFVLYTPNSFKNKTLEVLGSKNLLYTKQNIAGRISKYITIFNKNYTFEETYNTIWTPSFNPKDPESTWGTRMHKTVFPLTGNNVEIVPSDAKGYMLDHTCNATYYPESNASEAFSQIVRLKTNHGDYYSASVYCFVSEDYDGDRVSFGNTSLNIEGKNVIGTTAAYYDLTKKDVWQKLDIEFVCKKADVPLFISFLVLGVKDFSNLKGHVIFANPDYRLVENNDSLLMLNSTSEKNLKEEPHIPIGFTKQKLLINYAGFAQKSNKISFDSVLDMGSQDAFRTLVSEFVSEDTTFYGFQNIFPVNSIYNTIGNERVGRWIFSLQLFSKEYSWKQKIFGSGFIFLNWYGYYFLKDKTKSDWPHNPFLSILLYSGILGLLIYCYFMYKVFYYYIKYIKEYPLLFIFFLITFFFSFFSGGSPFDPPIMGFFSILPFLIHSIHKKEKSAQLDRT